MIESAKTLDIPYARKVLEHLIAHPDEHWQRHFGERSSCGTRACIAGTAVMMDSQSELVWEHDGLMTGTRVNGEFVEIEDRARALLGLEYRDAVALFYDFSDKHALDMLAHYIRRAEAAQG